MVNGGSRSGNAWQRRCVGSHAVDVVLLCVGACQEHALHRRLLVGPVGVHAGPLIVQALPNLHD